MISGCVESFARGPAATASTGSENGIPRATAKIKGRCGDHQKPGVVWSITIVPGTPNSCGGH
jgi:hypothetical protein